MRRSFLLSFSLVLVLAAGAAAQDTPPSDAPPADAPPTEPPPVKSNKVGPGGTGTPPAAAPAPVKKPAPAAKAKASGKGIYLAPITPVAQSVHVHDKVLDECRLQSLLPQEIAERNSEIVLSEGSGAMKLDLKIVDIHAPSGGWFSGPKWITVEGKLLQGKTVKGSFTAKETSMASATACGMLSKVITVLAADIAYWLENPRKDAMLGSAR
jgi:hypothetical protein